MSVICVYLIEHKNFIGYVVYEDEDVVGAIFAHRKTWWMGDELYVGELFVNPEKQGKAYGTTLLSKMEDYTKEQGLSRVTLWTDKNLPAREFYNRNEYKSADDIVFLYKNIE